MFFIHILLKNPAEARPCPADSGVNEPSIGFEPITHSLQNCSSTIELGRQKHIFYSNIKLKIGQDKIVGLPRIELGFYAPEAHVIAFIP